MSKANISKIKANYKLERNSKIFKEYTEGKNSGQKISFVSLSKKYGISAARIEQIIYNHQLRFGGSR